MSTRTIKLDDVQAIPLPKGSWSKKLLTRETVGTQKCMLGVSSFKPGTVTSLLVHEEEELAYVLAGRGKIRLKERDIPYQSGEGIYIPAGVPHAVVNDGEEEVIMVFTFSYPDYPPTQKIDTEGVGGRT
jgi:quercetin dioxygenase-like cupin family protein